VLPLVASHPFGKRNTTHLNAFLLAGYSTSLHVSGLSINR